MDLVKRWWDLFRLWRTKSAPGLTNEQKYFPPVKPSRYKKIQVLTKVQIRGTLGNFCAAMFTKDTHVFLHKNTLSCDILRCAK